MKHVSLLAAACLATAIPATTIAQAADPAQPAAGRVDFTRWEGRWYEVARLANWPQRNCGPETVATVLRRTDGDVSVVHQCRTPEGVWDVWLGQGRLEENVPGSTLGVRFVSEWYTFPPFTWGSYYALALDIDARYALLGSLDRDHLWVLSQTRTIDESVYQTAVARAGQMGFDTSKLIRAGK
jgi:apolipoprotein D and lipocalin family protein